MNVINKYSPDKYPKFSEITGIVLEWMIFASIDYLGIKRLREYLRKLLCVPIFTNF